jgi:hypothetical protein
MQCCAGRGCAGWIGPGLACGPVAAVDARPPGSHLLLTSVCCAVTCCAAHQAELVQQLQLVGLNNHAEQMLEDPTSNVTKVSFGCMLVKYGELLGG